MPNWKKLIVSGSDANLNSLTVETSLNAQSITGSLEYSTLINIPAGLISGSSQVDITQTEGFTTLSSSLYTSIDTQKSRIDTILAASDADKDSFKEIVDLINSVDTENDTAFGTYVTNNNIRSTQIENNLTDLSSSVNTRIDDISTDYNDLTNIPSGIVSSSTQIASDISGSFVAASSSIHLDISNLQAETINLDTRLDVFENSKLISSSAQITGDLNVSNVTASYFIGDGSQLTNVQTSVVETSTVVDSFSNKTTLTVPHNFSTKNVIVSVFNSTDEMIIPASIVTIDLNNVNITFNSSTSGRVVIAKGGHIVSGSVELYTYKETLTGSSTYSINHNLNEDFPIVQIYGTDKKQVIPAEITSSNSNQVQIEFNTVFNGTVVVKK
jgi:hypothetical protein